MDKGLYEARQEEAGDAFNSDPPSNLSQLIIATGDWLERLTGEPDAVRHAMLRLLDRLATSKAAEEDGRSWRREWEDDGWGIAHEMRRGQHLTSLMAFGDFGLNPDVSATGSDLTVEVGSKIAEFRELLNRVPEGWADLAEVERVILACEARYRIDTGLPVSAEQLAAISRLALRSIRNLMTPTGSRDSGLQPDAEGLVPADLAAAWLSQRPDFKSSLWQEAVHSDDTEPSDDDSYDDENSQQEWLFVPIAADGTAFTPDLLHDEFYTVGLKGQERQFSNYRDALDFLASSSRPSWRRPNPNGNWGIVRAREWQRRSARSLGLIP